MVIFSSSTRLLGNHLPKITDSGLYFAIKQPETYFLCDFMMKLLSVKLGSLHKNSAIVRLFARLDRETPHLRK